MSHLHLHKTLDKLRSRGYTAEPAAEAIFGFGNIVAVNA